ncbi:MAG: PAS domain-containing protein [Lysobacterales bacterium]
MTVPGTTPAAGAPDWLEKLFEQLPWGVLVADDAAFYLAANRVACTLLGRSRSEVVGKHLSDVIAPGRSSSPCAHGPRGSAGAGGGSRSRSTSRTCIT